MRNNLKNNKTKFIIGIIVSLTIILLSLSAYLAFFRNHDQQFLKYTWVSSQKPVFYHSFYKNKHGYVVEIFDKNGNFASIEENGKLSGYTLTFDGVDGSKDIYIYKNGFIHVKNISKNNISNDFTPLRKVNNGYK